MMLSVLVAAYSLYLVTFSANAPDMDAIVNIVAIATTLHIALMFIRLAVVSMILVDLMV